MDELDRILSSDEPLMPSSGFVIRVMESIDEASLDAPPLPFPWSRFVAGLAACITCAVSAVALATTIDFPVLSPVASQVRDIGPELGIAAAVLLAGLGALRLRRIGVALE